MINPSEQLFDIEWLWEQSVAGAEKGSCFIRVVGGGGDGDAGVMMLLADVFQYFDPRAIGQEQIKKSHGLAIQAGDSLGNGGSFDNHMACLPEELGHDFAERAMIFYQ